MYVEIPGFCPGYCRLVFIIIPILLKDLLVLSVESCVMTCVAVSLFLTEGVREMNFQGKIEKIIIFSECLLVT